MNKIVLTMKVAIKSIKKTQAQRNLIMKNGASNRNLRGNLYQQITEDARKNL